jgi:hypothetical protein
MTTRTFKQNGIAFGPTPVNITAKIDNVVVYEGTVETLDESLPVLPNPAYTVTNTLFSWTTDVAFSGNAVLEITTDGNVLLASTSSNYTPFTENGNIYSSGANNFIAFTSGQFGNTYINDSLQTVSHGDLPGMWWWQLQPSDTFVENITINPGLE